MGKGRTALCTAGGGELTDLEAVTVPPAPKAVAVGVPRTPATTEMEPVQPVLIELIETAAERAHGRRGGTSHHS